jgi:hypothetical protein
VDSPTRRVSNPLFLSERARLRILTGSQSPG